MRGQHKGFTLLEALTAMLIAGVACSAMLLAVSQSLQTSAVSNELSRGVLLATGLMDEIRTRHWSEPGNPETWGPEPDEVFAETRVRFDDLDDYDGWSGPAQTHTGELYRSIYTSLFPEVKSDPYRGYRCQVEVKYVTADGQPLPGGQTSIYRQVTVGIYQQQRMLYSVSRIFTKRSLRFNRRSWFDPSLSEPPSNPVSP